jgi:hypothetical protein
MSRTTWNVESAPLLRQHQEDPEDRDHVAEDAEHGTLEDRDRDIALWVLHLLGGAVLELEPDVVDEQHGHQPDEHSLGR